MQEGITRALSLGIVIVVIVVVAMAGIFVAGMNVSSGGMSITSTPQTSMTTTPGGEQTSTSNIPSGPPPAGFGQQVLQNHLTKLNNRDINGAVSDFQPDGSLIWSGTTQGLGGTYSGAGNIRLVLQTAIGSASSLSFSVQSFNMTGASGNPNEAFANAVINFTGKSGILGEFNGTTSAKYIFLNSGGTWLIHQESWFYKSFNVQYSQGQTTFPEWQRVGPPLPNRYSESPFKNWVYFYGGLGAAITVFGYLAALPLMNYVRKRQKP